MAAPQPQPPPRRFRIHRSLDKQQLRRVTALATGRTTSGRSTVQDDERRSASARETAGRSHSGRYEIVSMENSAFVFDSETSRFADVSARDWREQLAGQPQPPACPPASARSQKAAARGQRNLHGRLKTSKSLASRHDPLEALGKPDDTFCWPESLGGAAQSHPKAKDAALEARLKLPAIATGVESQRHRRLVRDGAPEAGAVVMYEPASQIERAKWAKHGGRGWPKLARLKRFRVQPADGDDEKAAGKATIELLLDGTVVDAVEMASLSAEPQPRWVMRDDVAAAARAAPPRYSGWNPEREARKQVAASKAGYAEWTGMQLAQDTEAWKAELAAREWEQTVFEMEEEDWQRSCVEQWEANGVHTAANFLRIQSKHATMRATSLRKSLAVSTAKAIHHAHPRHIMSLPTAAENLLVVTGVTCCAATAERARKAVDEAARAGELQAEAERRLQAAKLVAQEQSAQVRCKTRGAAIGAQPSTQLRLFLFHCVLHV